MTKSNALSMIGLAMRAGRVASGAVQIERAFKQKNVCLLLLDAGISETGRREYEALSAQNGVPLRVLEAGELDAAIGRTGRVAAAITDVNFSRQILKLIDGGVVN